MDTVSIVLNVLTIGIGLFLATPIYCVVWLVQQSQRQTPLGPGFRCLLVWLASVLVLLSIYLSGVWYTEHATVTENTFVVLFEAFIFIGIPAFIIRYLVRQRKLQ
jgi:hypothetical protein